MGAAHRTEAGRPWRLALAWLLGLGPFFYLSYGGANLLAARRTDVPSLVFAWEQGMPFVPWTIVPYWTLNLFYAAALFLPATRAGVNALGRQLLTAQVVAVTCFVLFPLRFSFARPPVEGVPGFLFDVLMGFDQPFNQAPSLHIALGVILWAAWTAALPRAWRWALHLWFALIGVSVLTTYQHHAIDIPTGALLGAVCLWLWPAGQGAAAPSAPWPGRRDVSARWRLGGAYAAGALACGAAAWMLGMAHWPVAGLLAWLGVALLLVASHYLVRGPGGFQKDAQGRMPPVLRALFAPYLLLARLNAWAWNRGQPHALPIADGVHLGALPRRLAQAGGHAVVDLCAELPVRPAAVRAPGPGPRYHSVPCLDLLPPPREALHQAAQAIEAARMHGPVRVCCALGRSRSAMAVAAWLLLTGRAADADAAIGRLRAGQPRLALGPAHRRALQALRAAP